ncbi:MAG: ABC transporter ATP-binding protein [Synechococcaceae cyanobacterium]|nr:ABC transporter ATP-binding protein [Synechococcaceae cyanobacterium]
MTAPSAPSAPPASARHQQSRDSEWQGGAILSVRNLSHSFLDPGGQTVPVLQQIGLEASEGEIMAIVGPSGCGKTTLLTLISGTRPIQDGSIRIDSIELFKAPPERLRRARSKVGIVFQAHRLISFLSVRQNVIAGIEAHRQLSARRKREVVAELLSSVGLENHGDHQPHQLSGGQRQRAGLARALANAPRLLIADEPTASLDTGTAAAMLQTLRRICRERSMAVVMSTHDPRIMEQADRVLHLRQGSVEEPF